MFGERMRRAGGDEMGKRHAADRDRLEAARSQPTLRLSPATGAGDRIGVMSWHRSIDPAHWRSMRTRFSAGKSESIAATASSITAKLPRAA